MGRKDTRNLSRSRGCDWWLLGLGGRSRKGDSGCGNGTVACRKRGRVASAKIPKAMFEATRRVGRRGEGGAV